MKQVNKRKSNVEQLYSYYKTKGYDLVDITPLVELKKGVSGVCNDFDEPTQEIYHIQIWYRDEVIAVAGARGIQLIDEDIYVLFEGQFKEDNDYVIFRKVKNE